MELPKVVPAVGSHDDAVLGLFKRGGGPSLVIEYSTVKHMP